MLPPHAGPSIYIISCSGLFGHDHLFYEVGQEIMRMTFTELDVEVLVNFVRKLKKQETLNLKLLNCGEPKRPNSI